MPELLRDFQFARPGRKSFYDWDKLLDGSIWSVSVYELKDEVPSDVSDEDAAAALNRFRRTAYAAASTRGIAIQTQVTEFPEKSIVLQAIPKTVD